MRNSLLFVVYLLVAPVSVHAFEMDPMQKDAWDALVEQIQLGMERNWDDQEVYIHPQISTWGPDMAAPGGAASGASGPALFQMAMERTPKPVAHNLVPVTVVVDGDVAIINFYLVLLNEGPEGPTYATMRGHNTWKKDGERWRLLATYNTWLE